MGREIKRVALDFDWPLDEIWHGYLNPHYAESRECPFCDGTTHNPATKKLKDAWYTGERWMNSITQDEVDALVESRRLMDFTHTWTREDGWKLKDPPYRPAAEEINDWSKKNFLGHDSINRWICVETRAKRLGVWGKCTGGCDEDGRIWSSPEAKVAYEAWEKFDPPRGDGTDGRGGTAGSSGYQMWETTTEGSPQSPVFDTPEKLARWLADNNASTFGHETTTYEKWLAFARGPGWTPSAMLTSEGVISGVDAASEVARR